MGNKQSDEVEQKVFGIVKQIPIVGLVYRVPRSIVYAVKNDEAQVIGSAQYDLMEEFNPIKKVGNITRQVIALTQDYDKGIWLGKRPLANGVAMLQLSLTPGIEVLHWAMMINGRIYSVDKYSNGKVQIQQFSEYSKERGSYNWTYLCVDIQKNQYEIDKFISRIEAKYYNLMGVFYGSKDNCQTFCLRLLSFVGDISQEKASFHLLGAGGVLF